MSEDKITADDIAALPTAAQGEIDRVNRLKAEKEAPEAEKKAEAEKGDAFDQEFQDNGAELVQKSLSKAYKKAFNEAISEDEQWAISKASGILFSFLRRVRGGGIIGGGVIAICLFLPFVPTILKKLQAAKQPTEEVKNG